MEKNIVKKGSYEKEQQGIRSDIKELTQIVKLGFERMDERFEDMHKRFTMMFTFMNLGMGIIVLVTLLVKFLQ